MVLMTKTSSRAPDVEGVVEFLGPKEGGRQTPPLSGYRGQFFYGGHDWDARQDYPDAGTARVREPTRVLLSFSSPAAHRDVLAVGTPFLVREGRRVVGFGSVTKLLGLRENADRLPEQ